MTGSIRYRRHREWSLARLERFNDREDRRAMRLERKRLKSEIAATIPLLRIMCERLGLDHWHISRVLGPGNWPLLYLNVCCYWSQRRLAYAFSIAPSLVCRRLKRIRSRLREAGFYTGFVGIRRKRQIKFTDCNGRNRAELLDVIGFFERPSKFNGRL